MKRMNSYSDYITGIGITINSNTSIDNISNINEFEDEFNKKINQFVKELPYHVFPPNIIREIKSQQFSGAFEIAPITKLVHFHGIIVFKSPNKLYFSYGIAKPFEDKIFGKEVYVNYKPIHDAIQEFRRYAFKNQNSQEGSNTITS